MKDFRVFLLIPFQKLR